MRVVLVRHATCARTDSVLLGRSIDSPLDAPGEAQAQALAEHMLSFADLMIECSPRRRTRQTAAAIAQPRNADIHVVAEMDEIDFGSWSGQSFAALEGDASWRRWNEQRSAACTPAGEDMAAVQARAIGHLRRLQRRAAGSTVAIVTHAEIIRSVVLFALNAPIDDYHRVAIAPASLTTLSVDGTQIRVDSVNERVCA